MLLYLHLSSIGIEILFILKKLTESFTLSASHRDSVFVNLCKGLSIIKSIEIDEVDIGPLIYEGVYKPRYPEPWASEQIKKGTKLPESLKNSPDLGHNGVWAFTFESPFYMWLLEHLY